MTEQAKRERENEHKRPTQGNLGQKDAQQQAQSDKEMSHMGETNKEKSKRSA